jgi:hypothetical protein
MMHGQRAHLAGAAFSTEELMQPLDTYDLYLNMFVGVVMPLIILANLMGWSRNPMNDYLWREHPRFMWLSMIIIGLLALWAWVQLAVHFGIVPAELGDTAMLVIGVPFLIAAILYIGLAAKLLIRWLRTRGSAV